MPNLFDEADRIDISVIFTWDLPKAEKLFNQWKHVAPTSIGGPAVNTRGEQFEPGKYLKPGYVITSRGCNNRCWFCSVWKRDGTIRELKITEGYNLVDDNILQCSSSHITSVFKMLKEQSRKPIFSGGIEAALLTKKIATKLYDLKPERIYFAYDTADDLEPLIEAGKMLFNAGFTKTSHALKAYVLIGHPKDTFSKALKRLRQTWEAGFFPMATLYRPKSGTPDKDWRVFFNEWANPMRTAINLKTFE